MSFKLPIPSQVKTSVAEWIRPSDWPVITQTANEIWYLLSDLGMSNWHVFGLQLAYTKAGSENIYVDWGDGSSISSISSGSGGNLLHTYTAGTGTPCSRGYTTWKIRIYTDPNVVLTGATPINVLPLGNGSAGTGGTPAPNTPNILECYFGSGTTALPGATLYNCEYVALPSTWLGTSLNNAFQNFRNLMKVILPTSAPNLNTMNNTFQACTKLTGDMVIPADATITSFTNTFYACESIKSFKYLNSSQITDMTSAFQNCYNIISIEFGDLTKCLTFTSLCNTCYNLQIFKHTKWLDNVAGGGVSFTMNLNSMFVSCYSLKSVIWPTSMVGIGGQVSCSNMFSNCYSLETMTLPTFYNSTVPGNLVQANYTTCNSMFASCYSLQSVIFPLDAPPINSATSMFQNCVSLQTIQLPTQGLSGDCSNMFNLCTTLKSFTFPAASTGITTISGAFSNCFQLQSVVFPTNLNSCTVASSVFTSCGVLTSITFPSMTACTTLASCFSGCGSITSITLPATMNSLTSLASTFNNCYELANLTLPTSATALASLNNTFLNCYSLKSITLPPTVNSTGFTNLQGTFSGCNNLESIVLPSTQITSTSLTSINSLYVNCGSLKTIANTDKIGSTSTTGTIIAGTNLLGAANLTGLTFSCRLSSLVVNGTINYKNNLQTLRLTNTGTGQWAGSSPQINISYCNLGYTALINLFNDIAAQGTVTTKIINITSNPGVSSLTAADRLILTSKGWTITG